MTSAKLISQYAKLPVVMIWTMHVKMEAEPISKSVVLGLTLEATN